MFPSLRLLSLVLFPLFAFAQNQAPVITQRPQELLVDAGQPATFSVVATGTPAPTYQWTFLPAIAGTPAQPIAGATGPSFMIAATTAADVGNYSVAVGNSAGTAHASADLQVNFAPVVTQQPADCLAYPYGMADFMVFIASYPPPNAYQWTKDGVNLQTTSANTYSSILRFKMSGRADVGFYALTATNPYGQVTTRSATLRLLDGTGTLILTPPRPQTILAGGSAVFSVPVPDGAPVAFQWYKDGVALAGATGPRLQLDGVQTAQAGLYTVQASRASISRTSSPARLTVIPAGATATYTVTTVSGVSGQSGYQNTGAPASSSSPALFNGPAGFVIDPSDGDLLVADSANNLLRQLSSYQSATFPPRVATFAGIDTTPGSSDGNALTGARFHFPVGLAADGGTRDVFVTDVTNYTIRRITWDGLVTTLAGAAGQRGSRDGVGPAALFYTPFGIVYSAGALFVADQVDQTIRRVDPVTGAVTTIAGAIRQTGSADGSGTQARFNYPAGIAADLAGNLYVADERNSTLRRITPAGAVSRFAGITGESGSLDGPDGTATFEAPHGLAVDGNGFVYVADYLANTIRRVAPDGSVTTIAGLAGQPGTVNGTGPASRFNAPGFLLHDGNANLYVASGDQTIRRIAITYGLAPSFTTQPASDFVVPGSTVILSCAVAGLPAPALQWFFNGAPIGGATGPSITLANVQTANAGSYTVQATNPSGTATSAVATLGVGRYEVSTFAGTPYGNASGIGYNSVTGQPNGFQNGPAASATFWLPSGVALLPDGGLVVTDSDTNTLRLVANGRVSTFAGINGPAGSTDGPAADATFCGPIGLAVGPNGAVFVAEYCNNIIRRISAGDVSTFAGTGVPPNEMSIAGSQNGRGPAAQFRNPWAVAAHMPSGRLFIADTGNSLIRAIDAQANVTTLAGQAGVTGYVDGPVATAKFYNPCGVAVDAAQNVYVADTNNNVIRKITPAGIVSTLAGSGTAGFADGIGANAQFSAPVGLAIGPGGHLYVSDANNNLVRRVSMQGVVTTIAGQPGVDGYADGPALQATFNYPAGLTVDASGDIYVADMNNNTIRLIRPAASQ